MRKILLLENDTDTLSSLKNMMKELEKRIKIYALDDAERAYKCALKMTIDLFIVDTTLEEEEGELPPELEFVDKIRDMERYYGTPILFITDLQVSKLYTYKKLNCYKMIGKPVEEEQFVRTVEDCLRALKYYHNTKQVFFSRFGVVYRVREEEIVYITMKKHKVYVHLQDRRMLTLPYMPMQQIMDKLSKNIFIQCRRDTIINIDYIDMLDLMNRRIQLIKDYGEVGIGETYSQYMEDLYKEDW